MENENDKIVKNKRTDIFVFTLNLFELLIRCKVIFDLVHVQSLLLGIYKHFVSGKSHYFLLYGYGEKSKKNSAFV